MSRMSKVKMIIEMYKDGIAIVDICAIANTSSRTVYEITKKAGIPKRGKGARKLDAMSKEDMVRKYCNMANEKSDEYTKSTYQPAKLVFVDNICRARGYAV